MIEHTAFVFRVYIISVVKIVTLPIQKPSELFPRLNSKNILSDFILDNI